MARRFYDPQVRPINAGGATYPGGKLYFYEVGTATPCTVYSAYTPQNTSTSLGSVVTADGNGIFPEIYLSGSQNLGYRVILKTSAGVIVYDYDVYNKPDGVTTGEITTSKLADGAVTTVKLATNAVTAAKITDGVITGGTGAGAKIAASTITANNLASDAVTTAKILDLNVTTGKLAASAVTTAKIADSTGAADGITTAKIATSAVTTAKIADSTGAADGVTTAKLATNAVTTAKITDANVTLAKLAAAVYQRMPIAGRVASNGTWVVTSALYSPESTSSWTITYPSTGVYTITHGLGTTNYSVVLTQSTTAGSAVILPRLVDVASTYFTVNCNNTNTGTITDCAFSFILVRQ